MQVYLALGANLGNRLANLQDGLRLLGDRARVERVSSLYETGAVGPAGQPPYWNAAALVETDLAPRDLLTLVKRIEWAMGRRPGERWGPRPLDIDLLFVGDRHIAEPDLEIPHPRIAERAFVVVPLADIAGDVVHPVLGQTVAALRAAVDDADVRRIAGPEWLSPRYLAA
jgi:2-amino-4-hydroxy-6-hydroxymethyldihydropteridine diphosphokinase